MLITTHQDNSAGLIRAYLSAVDGTDSREVSTLSLALAVQTPAVFVAWQAWLKDVLHLVLAQEGCTVTEVLER